MSRWLIVFIFLLVSLALSVILLKALIDPPTKVSSHNSAGNPSSYWIFGKYYQVLAFSHQFTQQGIASWYGTDFHGKKTSNGEIFDMFAMTAAHKTLPIPTQLKVTHLKNHQHIIVRVNDRGPYHENRMIDLSYQAAKKLGMLESGTANVKIEALDTVNKQPIYLQLGIFNERENANKLQDQANLNTLATVDIKTIRYQDKMAYKVQIGPLYTNNDVNNLTQQLTVLGIINMRYIK